MSFGAALSGLNAASADLGVIANNIANASTTGFKKSRAEFADVYAVASTGTAANAIGTGTRIASVTQQFTQGTVAFTDNSLDLAINGGGFFTLNDNGSTVYSRAGTFQVDRDGFISNNLGQRLIAFQADSTGSITGATGDLRLDTSNIAPLATSQVKEVVNLDAADTIPFAPVASSQVQLGSTGATITLDLDGSPKTIDLNTRGTNPVDNYLVDSYGNSYGPAQLRFTANGANWDAELLVDGNVVDTKSFSQTPAADAEVTFNWDTGSGAAPLAITMAVGGITTAAADGTDNSDINSEVTGALQGTFDPSNPSSYNNATSLTVYDSLGASHLSTTYYRLTGTPNVWEVYMYLDDTPINTSRQAAGAPFTMEFTGDGNLQALHDGTGSPDGEYPVPPGSTEDLTVSPGNGASDVVMNFDFSEITQYGADFSVFSLTQDGYTTGRLSGLDISETGVVFARYTNGQAQALGQVAVSNFANPQGMRQLGDTTWGESFDSGAPVTGSPGTGSLGLIQSGALEGSNVDISAELVKMITAQRNFQANAQVIRTNDTITQAIINIR